MRSSRGQIGGQIVHHDTEEILPSGDRRPRGPSEPSPSPQGLARLEEGVIAAADEGLVAIFHCHEAEIVGRKLEALVSSADRDRVLGALNGHPGLPCRARLKRPGGRYFDAELTQHRWKTERGVEDLLLVRDIAAELKHERALLARGKRFDLAGRGANDGLWEWDLRRGTVHFSARWAEMLGLGQEAIEGDLDTWLRRVHAEDLPRLQAELEAHKQGESSYFHCEYRILHMDGYHRWMSARGVGDRDGSGRPHRIAGGQSDITAIRMAQGQFLRDAFHHQLTGLPNRSFFIGALARHLEQQERRPGRHCAVLVVDVDQFTRVNESHGQRVGDELLVAVTTRLRAALRPGDAVAHLGSDEFALLVEGLDHDESADGIARRVHDEFSSPFELRGLGVFVTASIGVRVGREGDSAEALLTDAETAMQTAKRLGRGRTARFEETMRSQAVELCRLETELRLALQRGEFRVYYQPIVAIPSGQVEALEALIRWQHPERGLLAPAAFLDVAEESGLLVDVGHWLVDEGCRQLSQWRAAGLGMGMSLAVNFSDSQFADLEAVAHLAQSLRRHGLQPGALTVELTESVLLDGAAWAAGRMQELRAHEIGISMDDFGTGYSSLSYLHRFPADVLKIDRSFVSGLGTSEDSLWFVRTIVDLARSLGLRVVAEGVETDEQLRALATLGCDAAQGFLLGRPVPAEQIQSALLAGGGGFLLPGP